MIHRATITLDEEVYAFLQVKAGKNRSAYINDLVRREQQASLAELLLKANQEEAEDSSYQQELGVWDVAMADGLSL